MALGKNKKSEVKYHSDVEEFIPYAAHFDEETMITKNGELLQVIKITGFTFELIKENPEQIKPLRTLIRDSLKSNIKDGGYSVWMHTIRRESNLATGGSYKQKLANDVNEKWVQKNKWRTQFINELYITIVKEGEVFPIKNPKVFANNLFIKKELRARNQALLDSLAQLNNVTNNIVKDLQDFGARKLSIYKKEGVYYSELIGLASKIMNLRQEEIPLAPCDLSSVLPTKTVSFQYNTVQVEGDTKKHFGAIYSVKEYREITLDELDKLIQLPVNLIITQSFCFVEKDVALKEFEDQKKIYDLSNSKYMAEISGLNEAFDKDADVNAGYGEQQITVTVLEDTVKSLQNSIFMVVDVLRDMGLFAVREDLFMENCYWSMMPANFDFLNRKTFLPIQKIGGFGSLYNFTTGKFDNNQWGNALTTFQTAGGRPYFFNFHIDKNGHSLIVGDSGKEKEILERFLILQTQKYEGDTFILEKEKRSEVFISALGGKYISSAELTDIQSEQTNIIGINTNSFDEALRLLSLIESSANIDKPTLIFIDESLTSEVNNNAIEALPELMKKLSEKNAIIIFDASSQLKEGSVGIFSSNVVDQIETKIFLPNPAVDFNYKEIFKIKEKEKNAVKELNAAAGEIMIKKRLDSVVLKFGSTDTNKIISAFTDTPENLEAMQSAITEAGKDNTENLLVSYYSKKGL